MRVASPAPTHSAMPPADLSAPRWPGLLGIAGFVGIAAAQLNAFLTSPPDRDMGNLQKIMYVHVPAAMAAFFCFFIVFVASVSYLWRGRERDDLLAASAAEVGSLLTALTLLLGSIWARPTWGVWWTWDARLTSTAVLLVIFVGYLALRSFVETPEQRARWSAAVGILGALNVPVVYMSVKWWRTLHQLQSTPQTMDPAYQRLLGRNALAVLAITVFFVARRYYIARAERAIERSVEREALVDFELPELEVSHV